MNIRSFVGYGARYKVHVGAFVLGCLVVLAVEEVGHAGLLCRGRHELLNPLMTCDPQTRQNEWNYEPLREALVQKKAQLKSSGKLAHLSIYFRDLDHGPRFGIGEYDEFHPASLLKVPVMIAILHEADREPDLLDQTLTFTGAFLTEMNIEQPDETIEQNTPYTIRELLRKMIVYSDNRSKEVLIKKLNSTPPPVVYRTFLDLDVLKMMRAQNADYVSIQSYANLFAMLYNAGYLSDAMSQFALELLSESTFRDAIVAGVPPTVRVAHKFGFRSLPNGEMQLHDCGLVYHESATYLLCVMTSGTDIDEEAAAIADVSRMVYDAVGSLHSQRQSLQGS